MSHDQLAAPVILVDGVRYIPELPLADRVSIHGMYDCHLFHRIEGRTVTDVIKNWLRHNAEAQPAIIDGDKTNDLGPSMLCPAIVLRGEKELRRVGKMVFPDYPNRKRPRSQEELDAYQKELESDPDIPRLLACSRQ